MGSPKSFFGLPGSWKYPGREAVWRNMWDSSSQALMFPPKVWGFGWSFNFGYVKIKSKPFGLRCLAWCIGMLLIIGVFYALLALGFVTYLLIAHRV
jgi:hypothetical protein